MKLTLITMLMINSVTFVFASENTTSFADMIHHHQRGIEKAREMRKAGGSKEAEKLLDEIIANNERELKKMEDIEKKLSPEKGGENKKIALEMNQMEKEMDQVFSDFRSRISQTSMENGPKVEVREDKKSYDIKIEAPGMSGEDIKVKVVNNELLIQGRREEEIKHKEKEFTSTEFMYGEFKRSIHLAEKVDPKSMKTLYKDGILTVQLNKAKG